MDEEVKAINDEALEADFKAAEKLADSALDDAMRWEWRGGELVGGELGWLRVGYGLMVGYGFW